MTAHSLIISHPLRPQDCPRSRPSARGWYRLGRAL
jgi:hypothetical protein